MFAIQKNFHWDFVLKYVVIGGEKKEDFDRIETFGQNRDFFGTYSGADGDLFPLFAPKCLITQKNEKT